MSEPRVGVFVDVQNVYYTTRQAYGRQFNYRRLWTELGGLGEVVLANAYATYRANDDQQRKFQDALRHIGFDVKLRPYIQRADGSAKADWDVGITIDMIAAAADLDVVVLLSGDGDFDLLLNHVREQHQVETRVYGVEQLTAKGLLQATDHFHPIGLDLLN